VFAGRHRTLDDSSRLRALEGQRARARNPDVRFAHNPSPEADAKAQQFASDFEKAHPGDGQVPLSEITLKQSHAFTALSFR